MEALARLCVRFRWVVLAAWVVLVVGLSALSGIAAGDVSDDFALPGSWAEPPGVALETLVPRPSRAAGGRAPSSRSGSSAPPPHSSPRWTACPDAQWRTEVVTAQGRMVPAAETPWMRAREVMVHAVDLDAGVAFDDLPSDFLAALCEDIVSKQHRRGYAGRGTWSVVRV